jgi:hypothetical protein
MVIVVLDIVFDGLNQLGDATEHATSESLVGEVAEPSFDEIEPRGTWGREVDMEASVPGQPLLYLGS